ncbi:MAG: 3-keto-5-aminohexanoate cleavage enzyme [Actinomycetota bacterium]|nr:3-keto-5-aminohexanoate cleavage enzyme [Actinomycetota bacterium]
MDPLIITVAGIGAELTREQQPHLPITPDEIAADAGACEAAGASIYHLHVRTADGSPTMDVGVYRGALEAIRAGSNMIVQFSSGGAVGDDVEARIAPLDLQPEMATLTTGTVNFGDEVFSNPVPLIKKIYARMLELGIVPEYEIFEPGMIATAERVYEELRGSHHRHFDFVLGVPGAMPAWPDALDYLTAHLPEGATWSATGIGGSHLGVAEKTISMGGHVRTGFEDVRWFERGELATSNAQLVGRVVEMARSSGRRVAFPDEARAVLGLRQ